jgi:hypothetical protein
LLKSDPIHPLVDKKVLVSQGPSKGLYGCIKDVRSEALSVKLEAKVASSRNSCQPMKWTDLTLVWVQSHFFDHACAYFLFRPKTIKASRSTTDTWIWTPMPPPDFTVCHDLTPEPVGGLSGHHTHWIFSSNVHDIIKWKTIPFYIKHTHSADGVLGAYKGCVARTVPLDWCNSIPRDGEIMVSVIKRGHQKQISVWLMYLMPLGPIIGGKVVVLSGVLLGVVGVVKANQGKNWVVTFKTGDRLADQTLEDKDLAPLEDFK